MVLSISALDAEGATDGALTLASSLQLQAYWLNCTECSHKRLLVVGLHTSECACIC